MAPRCSNVEPDPSSDRSVISGAACGIGEDQQGIRHVGDAEETDRFFFPPKQKSDGFINPSL